MAVLAIDREGWAEAAAYVEVALAGIEEHRMHDYPTTALAFAGAARLALHRGDVTDAHRHLAAVMRVRTLLTIWLPTWAVRTRLQLAKAYFSIADQTAAVTCCVRSTTSCCSGQPWAVLSMRLRRFAG